METEFNSFLVTTILCKKWKGECRSQLSTLVNLFVFMLQNFSFQVKKIFRKLFLPIYATWVHGTISIKHFIAAVASHFGLGDGALISRGSNRNNMQCYFKLKKLTKVLSALYRIK